MFACLQAMYCEGHHRQDAVTAWGSSSLHQTFNLETCRSPTCPELNSNNYFRRSCDNKLHAHVRHNWSHMHQSKCPVIVLVTPVVKRHLWLMLSCWFCPWHCGAFYPASLAVWVSGRGPISLRHASASSPGWSAARAIVVRAPVYFQQGLPTCK